jgi:pimeloyl-ACP methyl ester carboxylesterase
MRRVLLSVAVLAVAWLALASQAADAAAPKVAWSSCYVQFGPFECTTVRVPLDYAHPDGETIAIAITRLPATDPAHRIGSLFLNPGGPGGSGVDLVVGLGQQLYTPEVRARFDLVGFDPRGIMRSNGLRCFGTQKQWGLALPPSFFPMTPAEEAQTAEADRTLNHACETRGTRVRDHMSTGNVARDLDVLRDAVGDDKLTYAGFSYGSYLGTTYANLFPDRVRAVVVDGVVDPIAWSTGRDDEALTLPFSTRLHSHDGAQATLDEFFRLCDAAGDRCAFSGGSAARFAALADRARQAPLKLVFPDGSTGELRYSDLIGMTLSAMYSSTVWKPFARMLADIERYASPAAVGASMQAFTTKYGSSLYPNFVEGSPAVACEDSDNPHGYAAWSRAGAQADASSYFGRAWTWGAWSPCAEWKAFDAGRYMGPFNKQTANPVLVVGSRFDPATRYEGAVTVHGLMPNSALLTVNGWGHTSAFMSACADAAVARYLVDIATPPEGTTCSQDLDPFAPDTPAAPAAAKRLEALSYGNGQSPRSRRLASGGRLAGARVRPGSSDVAWSDLTGSAIDALGAQTAVNDRGTAVYAWSSSDPATGLAEVRARTRSPRGRLGPIVAVSDPATDVFDVRVAMNARGAAAFTWLEYDAANDLLVLKSRSRSAGGALGPIATMSESGTNAFDHRVAISDDGDAIVSWTTLDLQAGRLHAKARVRPAAGAPGPVLDLADPALDSFGPQAAIDGAGIATFAWTQSDAATGHLSVKTRSLAPGGALGPASDVSDGARDTGAANVAVDRAGDAVFEWLAFDPSFHAVVQARLRSRKGALGPVVDLSDAADDAWDQTLAVDRDGDAVFTWWVPTRSGARVEASSLSTSGAVGPRLTLSDPGDDGYEPQVAVDADGDAAFTWLAFNRNGVRVQARARSSRGAFGATTDLTRPAEDAFSAQVAVTARGDAVFGWSALNGTGYQVQGRSRPAGAGFGPLTVISTIDRNAFEAQVTRTWTRLDGIADGR